MNTYSYILSEKICQGFWENKKDSSFLIVDCPEPDYRRFETIFFWGFPTASMLLQRMQQYWKSKDMSWEWTIGYPQRDESEIL